MKITSLLFPLLLVCGVAAPFVAATAAAQEGAADPQDERVWRARLWTICGRVEVDTYVDEAAQSLGVADPERLATMAENRLRAARLHRPDKLGGILTIEVEALDDEPINVYSVAVDFQRIMINPFTAQGTAETTPPLEPDRFAAVTVWHDGTIGYFTDMANAPANSVRTAASDAIDEFVRDYLRVNEMACVSN